MGCFWLGELIPIPATALLPVVLFPLLGIMTTGQVSMFYMKSSIMLFIGGLMVAIAVEHSNLHR
jgi:sodium-dependent dicarboxylate transporter 2/3/5